MILDREDPGKYEAVKKRTKMETAPGNLGVSTSVIWSSTPARTSTIAKIGDSPMNTSGWKVKVL
jgi:hypothetical protein